MANLSTKIKLYAQANGVEVDFLTDVILMDVGDGVYIHEWNIDLTQPTEKQLASYESDAQNEEALNETLSVRAGEYPSIQDQLDMQYHDLVNGTTTWKDAIQAVKDSNPKP